MACLKGETEIVQLLVATPGCQLDTVCSSSGKSVLMMAAERASEARYDKIVAALLDAGCAIDTQDHRGLTALMLAAKGGLLEVVSRLMDAGASIDVESHRGVTAEEIAFEEMHVAVGELLRNGPNLSPAHEQTNLYGERIGAPCSSV